MYTRKKQKKKKQRGTLRGRGTHARTPNTSPQTGNVPKKNERNEGGCYTLGMFVFTRRSKVEGVQAPKDAKNVHIHSSWGHTKPHSGCSARTVWGWTCNDYVRRSKGGPRLAPQQQRYSMLAMRRKSHERPTSSRVDTCKEGVSGHTLQWRALAGEPESNTRFFERSVQRGRRAHRENHSSPP